MPLSRTRILLPPRRNPIIEIVARSVVSRDLARAGDKDRVVAGLGVERDFAAASLANGLEDSDGLSPADTSVAARLALVGHDALPTACAQVSFFDLARIAFTAPQLRRFATKVNNPLIYHSL